MTTSAFVIVRLRKPTKSKHFAQLNAASLKNLRAATGAIKMNIEELKEPTTDTEAEELTNIILAASKPLSYTHLRAHAPLMTLRSRHQLL